MDHSYKNLKETGKHNTLYTAAWNTTSDPPYLDYKKYSHSIEW